MHCLSPFSVPRAGESQKGEDVLMAQRRRHPVTAGYSLESGGRRTGRRWLVQLEKEEGWDRENGVFHLEQWSLALSAQPPWDDW